MNRVIQIARAEIGYMEKKSNAQLDSKTANAGRNNYTKYARDLDKTDAYNGKKQGQPWCTQWVLWVFMMAYSFELAMKMLYLPKKGSGASATYWGGCYKSAGQFFKTPQVGDQGFFWNSKKTKYAHTGLVVQIKNGRVYTIEGNTSPEDGVVDNGGEVCLKSYPLNYNKIAGYGRPNWDLLEDEEMTQETFNKMMDTYLANLAKQPPADWSKDAREWAEKVKLIQGDGNSMQYKSFCTREQMVVFMKRLVDMI